MASSWVSLTAEDQQVVRLKLEVTKNDLSPQSTDVTPTRAPISGLALLRCCAHWPIITNETPEEKSILLNSFVGAWISDSLRMAW
jgi:hypothetical protein